MAWVVQDKRTGLPLRAFPSLWRALRHVARLVGRRQWVDRWDKHCELTYGTGITRQVWLIGVEPYATWFVVREL